MKLKIKAALGKKIFWGSVATILFCGSAFLVAPSGGSNPSGVSVVPLGVVLLSIRYPWIFFIPILAAVWLFWSDAQEDIRPMWWSLIRSTAVAAAIYVLEVAAIIGWIL